MNITVHYPKDKESLLELQKRVAVVHAEAVLRYIKKIPCPKEQKVNILTGFIKTAKLQVSTEK